ncbi:MAG: glycosyltransferase family 4 protein [Candidatus Marinimicrobia bacterium]|nr:glycosyltransferase family 4 protein [Candidatus Neomarinimicrobiota bacterium]
MKIVHIVPGTGGNFYCENCVRDGDLVNALRTLGHEVTLVPLYLPLSVDGDLVKNGAPIFFGAINTYLKERFPLLRKLPWWSGKLLDSRYLLNLAAAKAGSTRAAGLEEMTYSMIRGEKGHQANELDHLVHWLKDKIQPDIIYLANALLIGLVRELKRHLQVPVVYALENEDIWIDDMEPHWQQQIWATIRERARDVDSFVAVSEYYRNQVQAKLQIADDRMHIVHIGIDLTGYQPAERKTEPAVIGYLSRITETRGPDILVDAFILLKSEPEFTNLKLRITGGETADDIPFITAIKRKLVEAKVSEAVEFVIHFDRESRLEFLRSLTLLSVPARIKEAYGLFQIEALAAGVPTVQPHTGAFPEITELTGGGVTYAPNDAFALATQLRLLLKNPDRIWELGKRGQAMVFDKLSNLKMAENMLEIYQKTINTDRV